MKRDDSKIKSRDALIAVRRALKEEGRSVVFTNGCFDVLHAGHVYLFREAKSLGDVLMVALNDDASIRRFKGPGRPIYPLEERLEVLAALEMIDYLTFFSEDTPRDLIAALLPDVLAKGGDWGPDEIVGRNEVEAAGGRVIRIPYREGFSTSELIKKMTR
jgi:rfaE bifunctional protein nucleotidyltransferase chain/domain